MRQRNYLAVISTIAIFLCLISNCQCATGDLSEEEIDKFEESHLHNIVGFVPLYKGDSVSEFLKISEICLRDSCGPNCTVEPCNRFVLADIKLAYEVVSAFKNKLNSQYENIILLVMTATAICLSLYLWFVGHFSIKATPIYSFFYPNEEFQDPCHGIPMRLYTEMQFETLFNNEPRLKKIQKEEKKRLEKKKIAVDKSVQEFFRARPYLRKLENDPSILADLIAMKDKKEEDEDSSSLTDDNEHYYADEKKMAEEAIHKFFEQKEQEEEEQRRDRRVNFPDAPDDIPEENEETHKKIVYLREKERLKHLTEDELSLHPLGAIPRHAPTHTRHSATETQAHRALSIGGEADEHHHPDHHHRPPPLKSAKTVHRTNNAKSQPTHHLGKP